MAMDFDIGCPVLYKAVDSNNISPHFNLNF